MHGHGVETDRMGDIDYIVVDLITRGINVVINSCAIDFMIAYDRAIGTHYRNILLNDFGNLIRIAEYNFSNCRYGSSIYVSYTSPPFKCKICVIIGNVGKSICKFFYKGGDVIRIWIIN